MEQNPLKTVALIPARGGSEGIPGKNIRSFCGQPLLYWACKAAAEATFIDAVYVSTDDPAISGTVADLPWPKVYSIGRHPDTATNTASTESAMLDFAAQVGFDRLVLIQATSPLLTAQDLERGHALLQSGRVDSVLSVVPQKRFLWRHEGEAGAVPINYDPETRPRRQDFEGFLVENGAFYMTSREALLETKCRLNGRVGTVTMAEDTYFELDSLDDWVIAEALLLNRLRHGGGALRERCRNLRFVATDVDGCLTDSGMYYGEGGDELKKFNTRDGLAFHLLRDAGLVSGIITREDTALVARRAAKIRADELHQGVLDKVALMEELIARRGLSWAETAYLGDDLGDVELLKRVGLSACPRDAVPEVRRAAELHLDCIGGAGAFREFVERILAAKAE